jgi:MFS transporter, PAT family, beta-lactamase induction signal transducer AmpG
MRGAMSTTTRVPHPVVWTILYFPFGALGGFVTVALTFLATRHGLSITEGALLGGAQMISQWLKWTWAPVVDITLTP